MVRPSVLFLGLKQQHYSIFEIFDTKNYIGLFVCVCVYVAGGWGVGGQKNVKLA